jgi:hypothetical protein
VQARGYDDLDAQVLAQFEGTHIASLGADVLRAALAASVEALLREAGEASVPTVDAVRERMRGRA